MNAPIKTPAYIGSDEVASYFTMKPLRNKGVSTAYALMMGLTGIVIFGLLYTVFDQVVMGDLYDFNVAQNADGTVMQIFRFTFMLFPVMIAATWVYGMIATAHRQKNEM